MVEGLLTWLTPVHQLEFLSVMLHVAALTALLGQRGVKSEVSLDPLPQQFMALQASLSGDPLFLAVTFQTPVTAFKIGMGRAQGTRR